jgi:hypothetical protein
MDSRIAERPARLARQKMPVSSPTDDHITVREILSARRHKQPFWRDRANNLWDVAEFIREADDSYLDQLAIYRNGIIHLIYADGRIKVESVLFAAVP